MVIWMLLVYKHLIVMCSLAPLQELSKGSILTPLHPADLFTCSWMCAGPKW